MSSPLGMMKTIPMRMLKMRIQKKNTGLDSDGTNVSTNSIPCKEETGIRAYARGTINILIHSSPFDKSVPVAPCFLVFMYSPRCFLAPEFSSSYSIEHDVTLYRLGADGANVFLCALK